MLCDTLYVWWLTQSRITTLQISLIARQCVGPQINDDSGIKLSVKLTYDLCMVGPTGVQILDFCCSSISELVCCCVLLLCHLSDEF